MVSLVLFAPSWRLPWEISGQPCRKLARRWVIDLQGRLHRRPTRISQGDTLDPGFAPTPQTRPIACLLARVAAVRGYRGRHRMPGCISSQLISDLLGWHDGPKVCISASATVDSAIHFHVCLLAMADWTCYRFDFSLHRYISCFLKHLSWLHRRSSRYAPVAALSCCWWRSPQVTWWIWGLYIGSSRQPHAVTQVFGYLSHLLAVITATT